MITRLSASIIGLLAFAGSILIGLAVGNPFETIIWRALIALGGGMVVGWFAGYMGQLIVQENFRDMVDADIAAEEAAAEARRAARQAAEEGEGDPAEAAQTAQNVGETASGGADGSQGVAEGDRNEEDEVFEDASTLAARAARELINGIR